MLIVGAGLTGLAAAHHLAAPWHLIESEAHPGGKATSRRRDGYTFDVTGHWLHLRSPRVRAWLDGVVDFTSWTEIERVTRVWVAGTSTAYPFQANLHGLPPQLVRECLTGFVEAQLRRARGESEAPRTFSEFVLDRFGAGMAEHFFVPYNRKLWGVDLDELTPEWVSRFVPQPDLDQVIAGAVGVVQEGLGYNARFLYPSIGGIDALPHALLAGLSPAVDTGRGTVSLRTRLRKVDLRHRRVYLEKSDGASVSTETREFSQMISSVPLPRLIDVIDEVPDEVREAAALLRSVAWSWFDVALRRPSPTNWHWLYVADPSLPFFRVGNYSNALPAMAPRGGSSLYVEMTARDVVCDQNTLVRGLIEIGAMGSEDDLVFAEHRQLSCAYVLFDKHWASARGRVLDWLRQHGILSTGRYGGWTYNSMEDALIMGMEAADWVQAGGS